MQKGGSNKIPMISIKAARINANLKQKEVAKRMGIDPSTLGRWEKHPELMRYKEQKALAEMYNYPIDFIFFN